MLNDFTADPDRLRIVILSSPKTGNAWLRWLLHYVYRLPFGALPRAWSAAASDDLPRSFVTHQHLPPTETFARWLCANRVVVLTTIRHPGDTLVSYFHFVKWNDDHDDPWIARLRRDGERPAAETLHFARFAFTQMYALSLAWARLGAHVVRFEDLARDPVAVLEHLCPKIAPTAARRIAAATLVCKPEYLTRRGLVDPRHLRTRSTQAWAGELSDEIVHLMAGIEPYRSACETYGYEWTRRAPKVPDFDYCSIDPFRGQPAFDNGEPVGTTVPRIYLLDVEDATARWSDPGRTNGDSFWRWLAAPAPQPTDRGDFPPATLTNVMMAIHRMRPDLQAAYPDPAGLDRIRFVEWFLGQAQLEHELAWGLVAPVQHAHLDYLAERFREPRCGS